jgi:hypothetical protein
VPGAYAQGDTEGQENVTYECLATYVNVNGQDAWMLWDFGSTTSGVTPAFAQVVDIKILQLGTISSHANVNFGTFTNVVTLGSESKEYLNKANFD